ncbi:MAG: FIST N-terminal domain-containing protein [Planctomycetia bacterium]
MPAEPATPPTATDIRCAVAASTAEQIDTAIREAAATAAGQLGGVADVAVVFVSKAYGAAIRPAMEGLADLLGTPTVIGATAEAVLAGADEYESGPVAAVWLARLPGATIVPFALEYTQTPDGGMFVGWPAELDAGWPAGAAVVLLADPFSFPVDALIKRIEEDHPGVPIVGGMASGGFQPGSNTLVVGSRSYDSGAVGFVIGGSVRIRPVVSQGCRPIGRPMVITKSEENVIVELGGRPALERLREVYGELDPADRQLVRNSLHIGRVASEYQDHFQRGDFLVRNVVGADPDSGVIAVGDLVRTGQTIQFHVRDAQSAHDDLAALLGREKDRGAAPAGALVFTCNGRGTRLFSEAGHDARCLQDSMGPVPAAGFFAQGEIGPIGRRNCLHGFTASIALFEAAD